MKAVTFDPETDEFKVSELPLPLLRETDVLIKVDACGLNPVDAKIVRWKAKAPNMNETWVPGLDVSGHVVKVGAKVSSWQVGDRVLCHGDMFRPNGGFAEFTVQDSKALIPHPNLTSEMAAATPCAGWTAWRALTDKLRINEHNSILIAGGSGGVGGFAIQIAAHFNLEKIIVTCSAKNHDYVRSLGATHVIDYNCEDVVSRVLEVTNRAGVDIGLDTVGGDNDILVANSLRFEGQMVELVGPARPEKYQDAFMKGLSFHQLSLGAGHRQGENHRLALTSAGKVFSKLVEQGVIKVPELKVISMEQVGETLKSLMNQRTVGKIVLKMTD